MTPQPNVEITHAPPRPAASDLLMNAFEPFPDPPISTDPLRWPDYPQKLAQARQRTGTAQAVTAGIGVVLDQACVAITFHFGFLGGSMGEAEGALIVRAITEATRAGLPLLSIARSGGARVQEGPLSLFQMAHIASALVDLADAHLPHIAVVDDPTTGGIWAALTSAADVIIARAGAQVAFAGSRVRPGSTEQTATSTAENKQACGFIDIVVSDEALPPTVAAYLHMMSPFTRGDLRTPPVPTIINTTPTADPASGWSSVQAARSPQRRTCASYLHEYFQNTAILSGDRVGGVDPELTCGLGRHQGRTIAFICQSGGTTHASGFRTAHRVLKLAETLRIPVITLIDTSGADNTPDAELRGVGTAIAQLLQQIARCSVPVLSLLIGQGISGGAMALINPDNLWTAPESYLAVIAPEAAASILKQHPDTIPQIAEQLALTPQRLFDLALARPIPSTLTADRTCVSSDGAEISSPRSAGR